MGLVLTSVIYQKQQARAEHRFPTLGGQGPASLPQSVRRLLQEHTSCLAGAGGGGRAAATALRAENDQS